MTIPNPARADRQQATRAAAFLKDTFGLHPSAPAWPEYLAWFLATPGAELALLDARHEPASALFEVNEYEWQCRLCNAVFPVGGGHMRKHHREGRVLHPSGATWSHVPTVPSIAELNSHAERRRQRAEEKEVIEALCDTLGPEWRARRAQAVVHRRTQEDAITHLNTVAIDGDGDAAVLAAAEAVRAAAATYRETTAADQAWFAIATMHVSLDMARSVLAMLSYTPPA